MDIIIFSGQSNMQGQTESVPKNETVDGLYEYRFYEDELVPLAHPVGENIGDMLLGAHEGHGSLVPLFCKAYKEITGNGVVTVHIAKGATTVLEWLPNHSSNRYRIAVRKVKDAVRCVGKENIGNVHFVWLQGESDAIESTDAKTYIERIKALKNSLVRDIGINCFNFIRVGKFVNDERDIAIIKAQEDICKEKGFAMLTRITGYCTQDQKYINPYAAGHYNNLAMELIGKTAGANLGKLTLGQEIVLENEPYVELRDEA